jgi:NADP-dependent 3-hydroxy acid dehydrogenase YdfG
MSKNKKLPTVLITGYSSSHGEALAKLFVKNGYPTYASPRKLASIEELKEIGLQNTSN